MEKWRGSSVKKSDTLETVFETWIHEICWWAKFFVYFCSDIRARTICLDKLIGKKLFGPTSLNVRLAIPIVIHYIMYHNCFLTVRQTQPDIIQALPLL